MRWWIALAALAPLVQASALAAALAFRDSFDAPEVDLDLWSIKQLHGYRLWIDHDKALQGEGSLAIRVKKSDTGDYCTIDCQRNEIREAADLQQPFGTDVWYGFSFKVEGEVPSEGSQRWVIGQWKQTGDGSPVLAQRFDNGVFHVTIQDGDCRILLAQAPGDFSVEGGRRVVDKGVTLPGITLRSDPQLYDCTTKVEVEKGWQAELPDPYNNWVSMVYHLRPDPGGQGLVEVFANGELIARAKGPIGYPAAAGDLQYFKIGHYRDQLPGQATLYLDCFARGASRQAVDPQINCAP